MIQVRSDSPLLILTGLGSMRTNEWIEDQISRLRWES